MREACGEGGARAQLRKAARAKGRALRAGRKGLERILTDEFVRQARAVADADDAAGVEPIRVWTRAQVAAASSVVVPSQLAAQVALKVFAKVANARGVFRVGEEGGHEDGTQGHN